MSILGAPSRLINIDSNYMVMVLIWVEPYSLDNTDIELDITYYRVTVENIHTVSFTKLMQTLTVLNLP